jgi:protoheme IX farnesyltransferase
MPLGQSLANYWKLTKPRIWGLLVFTGIIAMLVAYRDTGVTPSLGAIGVCFVALVLGSASADVLTNYHDRDIDAMMKRTMNRPIPNGEVDPKRALAFGLAMAALSVLIPLWLIGAASAGFMFAGLVDNIIVYSLLLKRRSWTSIILGGISGGMPVLVGYSAVPGANPFAPIALYMSALVIVWIPTHIWSLAVFTKDDYAAAKVPMLPVVFGDKVASICIAATSAMLAVFSVAIFVFTQVSVFYAISAVALGGLVLGYSAKLAIDRDRKTAWTLFKITSPYLTLIFLVLGITVWF